MPRKHVRFLAFARSNTNHQQSLGGNSELVLHGRFSQEHRLPKVQCVFVLAFTNTVCCTHIHATRRLSFWLSHDDLYSAEQPPVRWRFRFWRHAAR